MRRKGRRGTEERKEEDRGIRRRKKKKRETRRTSRRSCSPPDGLVPQLDRLSEDSVARVFWLSYLRLCALRDVRPCFENILLRAR